MLGIVARVSSLLIVGGGKMGGALLGGLLRSGWADVADVAVVEPVGERRDELEGEYPGLRTYPAPEPGLLGQGGERIAGAVLAVKPDAAEVACRALGVDRRDPAPLHRRRRPLRSAWSRRSAASPPSCGRCPTRRPSSERASTAIAGGSFATSHDLAWAEDVLSAVGTVVRLPERQLDAVTGLSGSGPAYFFLVAEALIEAGVQMGLTREVSRTLVVETMRGLGRAVARDRPRPRGRCAPMVTSPAGTTAAGVRTLEARAVRSAFMEAVAAATERARNLQR